MSFRSQLRDDANKIYFWPWIWKANDDEEERALKQTFFRFILCVHFDRLSINNKLQLFFLLLSSYSFYSTFMFAFQKKYIDLKKKVVRSNNEFIRIEI